MCVCVWNLVDLFLFTGEGEGEAQRKNLSVQVSRDEEFSETGGDVVEQLGHRDTDTT